MAVLHRKRRWSGLDPISEEFGAGREMTIRNSDDFVTVECEYKSKTDKAVLIAQHGVEMWIPRSLIDYRSDQLLHHNLERGDEITLKVREWFASQESLDWSN